MSRLNVADTSISIRSRLLKYAREKQRPFNELLQYYGMERFLYRLSQSQHNSRFVLKGALLFHVWDISESRATRDIDLLAMAENSVSHLKKLVCEICELDIDSQDGVVFDPNTVAAEVMQTQREYEGIRVTFKAKLEEEKNTIPMQIDFGFGDLVTPHPESIIYPTLLDLPPPILTGYPVETVIAEKLHTIVEKGVLNSRVKDFHDVWLLLRREHFNDEILEQAVSRTFAQRGMILGWEQVFLAIDLYGNSKESQIFWERYRRKSCYETTPQNIKEICVDINLYLKQRHDLQPTLADLLSKKGNQELLHDDAIVGYFLSKLNAGVNLNRTSKSGHGILQLIIRHKQISRTVKFQLVKLLVEFGADINSSDSSSLTPFQAAIVAGNKTIADFLSSNGAKKLVPPGTGYAKYYNMYRNLPFP